MPLACTHKYGLPKYSQTLGRRSSGSWFPLITYSAQLIITIHSPLPKPKTGHPIFPEVVWLRGNLSKPSHSTLSGSLSGSAKQHSTEVGIHITCAVGLLGKPKRRKVQIRLQLCWMSTQLSNNCCSPCLYSLIQHMKTLIFGSGLGQFHIRCEKLITVSSGLRKKSQQHLPFMFGLILTSWLQHRLLV